MVNTKRIPAWNTDQVISLSPGSGARTADAVALLPANDLIRIPRGNSFLVFTITNIFNIFIPACSTI